MGVSNGATQHNTNGETMDVDQGPDVEYIGSRGMINRLEYIRLLQQALIGLGYQDIARLLEEQSGIVMQPQSATAFRDAVLGGDFEAAVALLPQLAPSEANKDRARFLILRHKYIECVQRGNSKAALQCLRTELQPTEGVGSSRMLQNLSAMLLHPTDAPQVSEEALITGRESLLNDLQALLPPSVLVPEARLEELIEQALMAQLDKCPYHNSSALHMSLLSDYTAGPEQLPTQESQVLTGHTDEVWWCEFSPDGKWLISGSKDGSALLWSISTTTGLMSLSKTVVKAEYPVNLGSFSPDSSMVMVGSFDGCLRVYQLPDCSMLCECSLVSSGQAVAAAAWMPDSKKFFAVTPDRHLLILDVELGGAIVKRLKQSQHIYDAVLSGDGGTVVMAGQDKNLRFLRLEDGKEAIAGPESSAVTCLSVSQGGRFLASNLANGAIHLWPLGDLRAAPPSSQDVQPLRPGAVDPLDALPSGPLQEYRMREDRPGRYIIRSTIGGAGCGFVASGNEEGHVFIWHRETGELLATMQGHTGTVNMVSWNPKNQHMLASASDDQTIRIWRATTSSFL